MLMTKCWLNGFLSNSWLVSMQVLTMTLLNLSFSAAGFLGIYHLGAAKAFLRHGDKLLGVLKAYAGASAGALIASLMVTAPDKLEVEPILTPLACEENRFICWCRRKQSDNLASEARETSGKDRTKTAHWRRQFSVPTAYMPEFFSAGLLWVLNNTDLNSKQNLICLRKQANCSHQNTDLSRQETFFKKCCSSRDYQVFNFFHLMIWKVNVFFKNIHKQEIQTFLLWEAFILLTKHDTTQERHIF